MNRRSEQWSGRRRAIDLLPRVLSGHLDAVEPSALDLTADLALSAHIGPALWLALRDLAPERLSEQTAERLRTAYLFNLGRGIRIRHQLYEALGAFEQCGVVPVALKGALHLLDATFTDPGARILSDLDLLIDRRDARSAVTGLERAGFARVPREYDRGHEIVLVHPEHPVPLELHLELGTARLCQVLSTEEVLAAATDGPAGEGGPWRQPSATHAVVHHLLHTLVSDRNWSTFTVSLRQLHTFDALIGHLGSTVDWVQVGSRLRSHGIGKAYESYLRMARRFFDTPLPYGEPVLAPMLADLAHDRLTLWNLAADNRPSIVYRNLSWALDGEYLRARYAGSAAAGLPLGALRAWHAGAVIRRGRSESLTQASIDYW